MKPTKEEITNRYTYHAPDDTKVSVHQDIRSKCEALAQFMNETLPEGRESSLVQTHLEQVMFWANAAVARS